MTNEITFGNIEEKTEGEKSLSISLFTDYHCLYVDAFLPIFFFVCLFSVFHIMVIVEVQSITWRGTMVYFIPVSMRNPSGFH